MVVILIVTYITIMQRKNLLIKPSFNVSSRTAQDDSITSLTQRFTVTIALSRKWNRGNSISGKFLLDAKDALSISEILIVPGDLNMRPNC